MPRELQKLDNIGPLLKSAKKRVTDIGPNTLEENRVRERAVEWLRTHRLRYEPGHQGGGVLSSHRHREFLRDSKYIVNINNAQLNVLGERIDTAGKQAHELLSQLQDEVKVLESFTKEAELKTLGAWDYVHHNTFSRTEDEPLGETDSRWSTDFKTLLPVRKRHYSSYLEGAGVGLGLNERRAVPISDVEVVDNETDTGDDGQPVVMSPVRNLLFPNKVFRYVIVKRDYDQTGRLYNYQDSYFVFDLVFTSPQLINELDIEAIGQKEVDVQSVSYLDHQGVFRSLSSLEVDVGTRTRVLFEPVQTRRIRVKVFGQAPVGRTLYNQGDPRKKAINKHIEGVGWTTSGFTIRDREIQGRYYDYSMKTVRAYYNQYKSIGVYRAKDLVVEAPAALAVDYLMEGVDVTTGPDSFSTSVSIADGDTLIENYAGVHLVDSQGNIVINELVPLPDVFGTTKEYLPIVGKTSRAKFLPDLISGSGAVRISRAVLTGNTLEVTTMDPHGFSAGETIRIVGGSDHQLPGEHEVSAIVDTTTFEIHDTSATSAWEANESLVPYLKAYSLDSGFEPFAVYDGSTKLVVGEDYLVSIDGGTTWHGDYPVVTNLVLSRRRAGDFHIKISDPDYSHTYWVEYKPVDNQLVDNKGFIALKHNNLVFSEGLRSTTGTINYVGIMRSDNQNPYLTSLLRQYSLKVRNYVS